MAALRAVSLFSNCGAGDLGYRRGGFRFEILAELEPHRLNVALRNHPRAQGVRGDLRKTLAQVLAVWRGRRGDEQPALLAACPPCQGLSTARGGLGAGSDPIAGSRDPRNLLVEVISQAASELRPRAIVVENVPAFLSRKVVHPDLGTPVSAALLLIDRLADDYMFWPALVDLADFAVPQTRRRSFLTLLRRGETAVERLQANGLVPYPRPVAEGQHAPLGLALEGMRLPPLDAASPEKAVDPCRPLHRVPVWSPRQYAMVAAIPADSGGSAWQNLQCPSCDASGTSEDTNCPRCGARLLRPIVDDDSGLRLVAGFRRSSYSRMDPRKPAATITTASGRVGSDNTLHPSQNRVLSVLECQLLQTIPESFDWGDALHTTGHSHIRAMIGEAVPPAFTSAHGRILASLMAGRRPHRIMRADDSRVQKACDVLKCAMLGASELNLERFEGALGA